jgi:hypothetical protein
MGIGEQCWAADGGPTWHGSVQVVAGWIGLMGPARGDRKGFQIL